MALCLQPGETRAVGIQRCLTVLKGKLRLMATVLHALHLQPCCRKSRGHDFFFFKQAFTLVLQRSGFILRNGKVPARLVEITSGPGEFDHNFLRLIGKLLTPDFDLVKTRLTVGEGLPRRVQ